MAKSTVERRIINHIENAYTGDLQNGKNKILVIKLSNGLSIEDLSYLYTTASDLVNRFGCLTLFVDDKIESIDIRTMKDFLSGLNVENLEEIRDMVDEMIVADDKNKAIEYEEKQAKPFEFIDLRIE